MAFFPQKNKFDMDIKKHKSNKILALKNVLPTYKSIQP
jgi:hypothetical protein